MVKNIYGGIFCSRYLWPFLFFAFKCQKARSSVKFPRHIPGIELGDGFNMSSQAQLKGVSRFDVCHICYKLEFQVSMTIEQGSRIKNQVFFGGFSRKVLRFEKSAFCSNLSRLGTPRGKSTK